MITIKNILLFVLVFILIIWFFESSKQIYTSESFDHDNKPTQLLTPAEPIFESPVVPKLKTIPPINSCPLKENDLKSKYYISKFLMADGAQICPKPIKSAKEFNKDFYNFRDAYTNENSSQRLDAVDKIINLKLQGNLDVARDSPDLRIKDVFDELTRPEQNLYSKECVRLPYFDNTMHDGYDASSVTGMHNVQDDWKYSNEKSLNGGPLEKNFFAYDPMETIQFPALS